MRRGEKVGEKAERDDSFVMMKTTVAKGKNIYRERNLSEGFSYLKQVICK